MIPILQTRELRHAVAEWWLPKDMLLSSPWEPVNVSFWGKGL